MQITLNAIGVVHSPFTDKASTPIQSARSTAIGEVEVFPDFEAGLEGIEEFSHIILIYSLHDNPPQYELRVRPFLDDQLHGVFATRYPVRPNSIGLSVVKLIERKGNQLVIQGVDMLDGTPLLDIKPYVPDFDVHPATKVGWYDRRAYR
jgi:tRNA-Thr(GGU) m(6)t(6)A37 methyltransferase TsaA